MKKIAVFNDISGLGKCSLTASIPIISALGLQCCPVPTAVLSNQTGYPSYHCFDLTSQMEDYLAEWQKLGIEFDAILTGFLASDEQARIVSKAVDMLRGENTLVVVDPVMADDGKLYKSYDLRLCKEVAALAEKANVITPNLSELCLLAQKSYKEIVSFTDSEEYLDIIAKTARRLLTSTLRTVIVTGIKKDGCIYNIVVEREDSAAFKTEYHDGSFSGTGDIFASVVTAELTKGMSVNYAVSKASTFIEKGVRDAINNGIDRNDGIDFEKHIGSLINE